MNRILKNRSLKIWLFVGFVLFAGVAGAHAATISPSINPQIPGVDATGGPSSIIKSFYLFAMAFGGALALAMVIYGGIQMMVARGNTGQISDAKDRITQALFGLLLLAGAYIILNTINPKLTDLSLPKLAPVKEVTDVADVPLENEECAQSNWPKLAVKYNNALYPRDNAQELNTLIACITSKVSNVGSQYTYDIDHEVCNYTRGHRACGPCSHTIASCHYGGNSGIDGSLAVDFGNEQVGDKIITAATACGAKSARCETSAGQRVACSDPNATHVHVSAASCDTN